MKSGEKKWKSAKKLQILTDSEVDVEFCPDLSGLNFELRCPPSSFAKAMERQSGGRLFYGKVDAEINYLRAARTKEGRASRAGG